MITKGQNKINGQKIVRFLLVGASAWSKPTGTVTIDQAYQWADNMQSNLIQNETFAITENYEVYRVRQGKNGRWAGVERV
jgi:hypothetical protein